MRRLGEVFAPKYLVIDAKNVRIAEVLTNICLFISLFIIGSLTGVLYYTEYLAGNALITPIMHFSMEAKLNNHLFDLTTSDFLFWPPSDWIMMTRIVRNTNQKVSYCEDLVCDNTCIQFKRPCLNPGWCPLSGYLDDLVFPSIEFLRIEVKLAFASTDLPSQLKMDKSLIFHTYNFDQLLKELKLE